MTAPRPPDRDLAALAERARWGQRPNVEPARAERPRMRLISWKPITKGSLRGFVAVELPIGLKIHDVPVLVSNGKAWAALPSKPQIDKEGKHKTDANGKAAYVPVLEWKNRELNDRFSAAVVEIIRREHPDALDDGTAP